MTCKAEFDKSIKVSVVIPCYNSESTITDALESVYSQGLDNSEFEVIVIDDGSTDKSKSVIENYLVNKCVDNLKLISQPNSGVASARNKGINNSAGEFIAFLDSDDKWLINKINIQLSVFDKHPDVYLCAGLFNKRGFDFKRFNQVQDGTYSIPFSSLIKRNYFQPSTVMIRREAIEKCGLFKQGMTHAEEGIFFYNICHAYKCVIVDELVIEFGSGKSTFGESGLSGDLWKMEKGELSNYKDLLVNRKITTLNYMFLVPFSILKFLRRVFISKII